MPMVGEGEYQVSEEVTDFQRTIQEEVKRALGFRAKWLDETLARLLISGVKRSDIEIIENHEQRKTTILVRGVPQHSYTIIVRGKET
jgi:hypothetical protein